MKLIDFCGLHKICRKFLVLAQMGIVHPPKKTNFNTAILVLLITPFHSVKSAKAAVCTHADSRLWFYAVFYLSVSEDLIQFPFHGARLGKFQRIRLTDMVSGDAVILCKAQNVADGNAVDDRKP